MGMDVHGKEPTAKAGEYFRNNVWWWRPLWDYCRTIAPGVISAELHKCGHSNDGEGLTAKQSAKLAAILRENLASGRCDIYANDYTARQAGTPDEDCELCGGTGYRKTPPATGAGDYPCNGCDHKGHRRPYSTRYPFSSENVAEFATFLEACGGFSID